MGIDFSNEGLAGRVIDLDPRVASSQDTTGDTVGTDSGAAHAEAVTADPTVDAAEVAGVETDEADLEEAAAESAESNEPDPQIAEVGAEEETYRQRYENLVGKLGEQGRELGEYRSLKAELEALKQQVSQGRQPQGLLEVAPPTTVAELFEQAADPQSARAAFDFARQNAPEYLADVLAEVAFHDPAEAQRMQLEYVHSMLDTRVKPAEQRYQQAEEVDVAAGAVQSFAAKTEGWVDIKDEVADIVEAEPWLMGNGTNEEVHRGLAWATRMVKQQREAQSKHAEAQRLAVEAQRAAQSHQTRQDASVESGAPGGAPVVAEVSAADAIRAGIFKDDERVRRAIG